MAGDAVRPGELPKQPLQSITVALDIGIPLRVRAFEIAVRHQPRTAMTGTDDVDHVQVALLYEPIQVNIDEIKAGRGAPMSEQTGFDVLALKRTLQQWIVLQIDLPDAEVVRGAPIRIHFRQ